MDANIIHIANMLMHCINHILYIFHALPNIAGQRKCFTNGNLATSHEMKHVQFICLYCTLLHSAKYYKEGETGRIYNF